MTKLLTSALCGATLFLLAAATAEAGEKRCGWLANPSPANWLLIDRDASWWLMTQGGPEPEGMDLIGDISAGDYVAAFGNYGYACACLTVEADADAKTITRITAFRQLPIRQCRNDKALPAPEEAL